MNRQTVLKSHRHLYSSEAEFEWEDDDGRIIGSKRYLELGEPGPDVAGEAYPIPTCLSDGHRGGPQPD